MGDLEAPMEHTHSDSPHGEEGRGLRSKLRRLFGRSKGRHASSSEEYWIPEGIPDYRPPEPQWTLPTPTPESLHRAESHGFQTAASIDAVQVPPSAYQVVPPQPQALESQVPAPQAPLPEVTTVQAAPPAVHPEVPPVQLGLPGEVPPEELPTELRQPQVPQPEVPAPQAPVASTGFESARSWEGAAGGGSVFDGRGLSQTHTFAPSGSLSSVSPPSTSTWPQPAALSAPAGESQPVPRSVGQRGEGLETELPVAQGRDEMYGEASLADSGVTIVEKSTEPLGGYLANLDLDTESDHPSPPLTSADDYRYAQAPDRRTLERIYLPSEPPEPVPGTAEAFESVEQPAPPEPPPPPPIAVARSTGDYTSEAASVARTAAGAEDEATDTGGPGSFGKKRVGPPAFAAEPDVRHVVLGFKDGTAVFLEPEHPLFSLFFQWSELVVGPETPPKMYARREAQRKYYLSKPGRRAKGGGS